MQKIFLRINFNTTFVSVRQGISTIAFTATTFQYNICFGSTMERKQFKEGYKWFQYNICFGSTMKKK